MIGADGFGFARDRGTWVKVPQVGTVRIGDDVEIGANTTIDRGAIERHDGRATASSWTIRFRSATT